MLGAFNLQIYSSVKEERLMNMIQHPIVSWLDFYLQQVVYRDNHMLVVFCLFDRMQSY